jgi:hypothetical protein
MTVVRMAWVLRKKSILVLAVVFLVSGVAACGKPTPTPTLTPTPTYELTHSAADVEYILNWDLIVSQCPDIGAYDKIEAFVYRGETVQITPGETFGLDADSPAAWASARFVRTQWEGKTFRSFGVHVMFSETAEDLDELVQMLGFPVQKEGDFATAVRETDTPMQAIELLVAGKHFAVLIGEFASSEESLFFDKDASIELLSIAKSRISASEITPLPPEIPERKL